ncbi:MAG: cytochrome c maturation protein CcmE [Fimbriimonadaceae bacterium]|nr:MAG: Cytochrome c-type biogenesis protein CcmE [Armatimonadetes bacterium OLB18]WKZ81311.1 MAG: cytochrome c maturation protein CcmE [Fimbriimonadaceae bacterium]
MSRTTGSKLGLIVSVIVGALAITGMVTAFLMNASPYVTIAEAGTKSGKNLHVVGKIDKASLVSDMKVRQVRFTLLDEEANSMSVVFHGPPPANMGEASQVVVIGEMKEGAFHAERMLIKCPSKYQGQQG